jgi:hypothetical protein
MDLEAPNKWIVADLKRKLATEIDPDAEVRRTEHGLLIRLSKRIDYQQRTQISSWIRPSAFTIAMPLQ